MPGQTSAYAGHHYEVGPMSDRECPCLTLRSGMYRARLGEPDTAGGLQLVDVVAFNLGIIVERLGGIETRHHGLREWIDRWMDR